MELKAWDVALLAAQGNLIFGVFTSKDGFPTEEKKAVNWQVKKVDGKSVTFECQLPPGKYGASVLHDENSNGKMDMSMHSMHDTSGNMSQPPKQTHKH